MPLDLKLNEAGTPTANTEYQATESPIMQGYFAVEGDDEGAPKKQSIKSALEQATTFISSVYDLRINTIRGIPEIRYKNKGDFKPLTDNVFGRIYVSLKKEHCSIGKDLLQMIMSSDDDFPAYDPIQQWFAGLQKIGGEHAIKQLTDCIELEEPDAKVPTATGTITAREAMGQLVRRWLIVSAACALQMAPVNSVCWVWMGGQGLGKTRFFRNLVPAELRDYYEEGSIEPNLNDERTATALAERWIINIDDQLDSIMSRDYAAMKNIITNAEVNRRKAYGRFSERRRRLASFVASVNREDFLADVENRRYMVFKVKKINVEKMPTPEMLWAEVSYLLSQGKEPLYFSKAEETMINAMNEEFAMRTPEEDLLGRYFEPAKQDDAATFHSRGQVKFMNSGEIFQCLEEATRLKSLNYHRLNRALKRLGFQYTSSRHNSEAKGSPRKGYWVLQLNPNEALV